MSKFELAYAGRAELNYAALKTAVRIDVIEVPL